jgi:Cyclic nucleotide-binding domain.
MDLALLKQSFNKLVKLSEEEWEVVSSYIHFKTLSKGEILLKQDEVCNNLFILLSGTVIYYQLTLNGSIRLHREYSLDIMFGGVWSFILI